MDGIYRISTWIPGVSPDGFTFNQFLVAGDEPLLFHTGPRGMFPLVAEAVAKVLPVKSLRWITFGHVESDECGSMNMWLTAAPNSQVAYGALGCDMSLNDLCDRPPRALAEGEVIDLGGKRVRQISTPHVPHGWEAQVLYEETTGTLFCGDLFSQVGARQALTTEDVVEPALAAERMFHATCLAHTGQICAARRPDAQHARHHARNVVPGRREAGAPRPGRRLRVVDRPRLTPRLGHRRSCHTPCLGWLASGFPLVDRVDREGLGDGGSWCRRGDRRVVGGRCWPGVTGLVWVRR